MRTMRILAAVLYLGMLSLPPGPVRAAGPTSCGGGEGIPQVFTGTFGPEDRGSYLLVPFTVPSGMTRVRVRLCHDQIDIPGIGDTGLKHTLDLGVYDTLQAGNPFWGADEFRGWGGSSRLNVLVTPEGGNTPSAAKTTVGFKPGDIPAGLWAAEIGVAAISEIGDADGRVAWRLEAYTAHNAADTDEPWVAASYAETPVNPNPAWYKGDLHVHAIHSNPNNATMDYALGYAFGSRPGGAGLDFITLSDYVTNRHWDEIHRPEIAQFIPDGKLVIRSAEMITYRGHINNHASHEWVDYRAGPVFRLEPDGTRTPLRGGAANLPSTIFDAIHAANGWTQVNHPTIFPSKVPPFALQCRGCSWEYSVAETDWSKVDSFEVQTGPSGFYDPDGNEPGPNPFTPAAIEWWDRLRRAKNDITAVGVSDSHRGGADGLTFSPIGEATTVVYAPELSEAGIRAGVLAGHAYVKFFASDGPDLRLEATPATGGPKVMMGDALAADAGAFTATVLNLPAVDRSPGPRTLVVVHEGLPILAVPVPPSLSEFSFPFVGATPGDYRIQLMRGTAFEALTNPITLCPVSIPAVVDPRCT